MAKFHLSFYAVIVYFSIASSYADMAIARRYMAEGNTKAAYKEYLLSAEEGHLQAQVLIVQRYQYGSCVDIDHRVASKWSALAADRGLDKAQNNLATMYLSGRGIIQDTKMAQMFMQP